MRTRVVLSNRIFLHGAIMCVAFALVWAPWGWLPQRLAEPVDMRSLELRRVIPASKIDEEPVAADEEFVLVSGWQGQVAIGSFPITYWGICLFLMMGALSSGFNSLSWTRLSPLLMFSLYGLAAATALVAICHHWLNGQVGAGPVIALASAFSGIANLPEEQVVEVPAEVQSREQAPPAYRSAA